MSRTKLLDPVRRSVYLRLLKDTGSHVAAREGTGIHNRKVIDRALKEDPTFAEEVAEARAHAYERLEGEAYRRAVIGIEEPVFHMGKHVGFVKKYSDQLLGKLLEANDPVYRKKVQLTGNNDGPISISHDLSALSEEKLKALEEILGNGSTSS